MSMYSIGDETKIKDKKTSKDIDVIVTNVMIIDGVACYFVRRKDNKPFHTKNGYGYNMWIKGETIGVSDNEQIK